MVIAGAGPRITRCIVQVAKRLALVAREGVHVEADRLRAADQPLVHLEKFLAAAHRLDRVDEDHVVGVVGRHAVDGRGVEGLRGEERAKDLGGDGIVHDP
jgi:hypothetical protein